MAALPRPDEPVFHVVAPIDRLPFRIRPATPFSPEQLFQICRDNPQLRIEQSADGEILIMGPTGMTTGARNAELTFQIVAWARDSGIGIAYDSSTAFTLPNGAVRAPDASWVAAERVATVSPADQARFAPICPDFVVELRSPSDSVSELQRKLEEYIDQGARLGWLIDPEHRRVHVYRPGAAPTILDDPTEVRGDPVLPGFVLDAPRLW